MRQRLEFDPSVVPVFLQNFIQFLGWADLDPRLKKVSARLNNFCFDEASLRRYKIPLGLKWLVDRRRFGLISRVPFQKPWLYEPIGLIAGTVSIAPHLTEKGRNKLRGQLLEGLHPNGDVRSIAHELRCAVAFLQQNCEVEFPDLDGEAPFDLLVRRRGSEFEVEAKVIHGDTGWPIKYDIARTLGRSVIEKLATVVRRDRKLLLHIRFPASPPREQRDRDLFIEELANFIRGGPPQFSIGAIDIEVEPVGMEHAEVSGELELGTMLRFMEKVRDRSNGHVVFGQGHCVVLLSSGKTKLLRSAHDALKKGANQCSGQRPAMIWAHFVDMNGDDLQDLHKESQSGKLTGIDAIAQRLFRSPDRSHIYALGFSAEEPMRIMRTDGSIQANVPGRLLSRINPNCRFGTDLDDQEWLLGN